MFTVHTLLLFIITFLFNECHLHTSSRMTVVGEPINAMAELTFRLFPPLEEHIEVD